MLHDRRFPKAAAAQVRLGLFPKASFFKPLRKSVHAAGTSSRGLASQRDRFVADDHSIPSGVAGRYASALFDIADEDNDIDGMLAGVDRFAAALVESADLARLVRSPIFSAEAQIGALDALLPKLGITGIVASFLKLLAKNRRLFVVGDAIKGFRALVARKRGLVTAEVRVAEPMSDAHTEALKDALKASTGKDIVMDTKIDPSLIGGLIVKIGSRMIDTSLKTKLSQLKIALKEVR